MCIVLCRLFAFYNAASTYFDREQRKQTDVIGIALKPTCVSKRAIKALNRFFEPRRIVVVSRTEQACATFRSFATNVECLIETRLLPDVSRESIRDFLSTTYGTFRVAYYNGRDSSGWYLQQFLKLGVMTYIPDVSDYYVVWDLDMILLRELNVFHSSKRHGIQTTVNIGGNNDPAYDYAYRNLTGESLRRAADGTSFVTHWVIVYKPYMIEFVDLLSSRPRSPSSPAGSPWVWSVLSALDPDHLDIGFSEYASYVSWVMRHHPDSVYEMPRRVWVRHPFETKKSIGIVRRFSKNGLCCPTDFVLDTMRVLNYLYTGFEIGHSKGCDYNNPKYQDGYGV